MLTERFILALAILYKLLGMVFYHRSDIKECNLVEKILKYYLSLRFVKFENKLLYKYTQEKEK